nr:uncharacterized protein LOC107388426 [Nothobranchius furzeri]
MEEKARIEATLNALKIEGEAEAALAAAHVLEVAADEEHNAVDVTEQGISKTPPIRRTQDYVNAHFANIGLEVNEDRKPNTGQLVIGSPPGDHLIDFVDQKQSKTPPTHRKNDISTQPKPSVAPQTELSDFTAYIARHDLLTAGFKVFDNCPESYLPWKSIFCNATEGLNLKSSEELDPLTNWLSGESLQHALRIRTVHVNNPQAGLKRLWQRLDSRGHRAKDCKAIIQCSECNRDAHVSAMHAGPPPWTTNDSNLLPQSHGGEPDCSSPVTTTSCTEMFGSGLKDNRGEIPTLRLCRLTLIYRHSLRRSLLWTQLQAFSFFWGGASFKLTRSAVRCPQTHSELIGQRFLIMASYLTKPL